MLLIFQVPPTPADVFFCPVPIAWFVVILFPIPQDSPKNISLYSGQGSRVRPNFSRVRQKKNVGRTGASSHLQKKKKKSLCDSKSLLFDNRYVRLIAWSKPIRDSEGRTPLLIGRGSDIPVCVCAFEDACAAAVKQRERLVVEMRAALSLNLICSVSISQSLKDSAIAEFIAKSSNLRYFPNCRRFCT